MRKGRLILENGKVYDGLTFGYESVSSGEVVFNTSLTGYQEILTDPSYAGQIVVMTYPLIGNYGVNSDDIESSEVQVSGFVVGNYEDAWSNFKGEKSLDEYLKESKVTGFTGIDTRELTKVIRCEGAMRGIITNEKAGTGKVKEMFKDLPVMSGLDLVQNVSTEKSYIVRSEDVKRRIAVYDFGMKKNILREFLKHNIEAKVFNARTDYNEVLEYNPDGIFLSNGPGDPDAVKYGIENTKHLIERGKPVFGICLGHQLIALALGGRTYKLKFGHRGANHPVKNHLTNKIEITSQNHGFAVDTESLDSRLIEITHTNLYDGTNEGLRHKELPVMSVQYHPEASPGPHDSKYLFKDFLEMIDASTASAGHFNN